MDPERAVTATGRTYDRIATEYAARSTVPSPEFAAWRDAWAAGLPPGSRLLDLGCGPGQHAATFRAAGLRAYGLDLSAAMVALASDAGVPAVRGDLRRLPYADGSAGAVWCAAALLHVPRAAVPATLAEWRRVARPGASLALSTSLGGDEGWEVVPYAPEAGPVAGPLHRWFVHHDPDDLLAFVGGAGWRVEDVARRTSHRDWLMVRARA